MCAFDSQHVKLCSILLCEIFSLFAAAAQLVSSMTTMTTMCVRSVSSYDASYCVLCVCVSASCLYLWLPAIARHLFLFDFVISCYLRSAISIAYIFLRVSPFIYLVVGAFFVARCSFDHRRWLLCLSFSFIYTMNCLWLLLRIEMRVERVEHPSKVSIVVAYLSLTLEKKNETMKKKKKKNVQ